MKPLSHRISIPMRILKNRESIPHEEIKLYGFLLHKLAMVLCAFYVKWHQ